MEAQEEQPPNATTGPTDEMLSMLRNIQQQMTGLQERVATVEAKQTDREEEQISSSPPESLHDTDGPEVTATPESVRANTAAMADVAAKLAAWGLAEDVGDLSNAATPPWRPRPKRSGTVSKGTDVIKNVIDWPHYHIRKGPNRTPPEFAQLSAEEFVLGYLRMLKAPDSKFDNARMLEILLEVMEDAVDFGWDRARSFYGMVGLGVEHNEMGWADKQELLKMRLTHSRTVLPAQSTKPDKPTSKAPIKACAAYQVGTCDQLADHTPYRHVCEYCLRVRNFSFHHPESECRTKRNNQPKNA